MDSKQGPEKKDVLHPVFGTYCRTQTFAVKAAFAPRVRHVHYEIYLEDPATQKWSVNKVTQSLRPSFFPPKEEHAVDIARVSKGLDFAEAVKALAEYEKDFRASPALYSPLVPEPAQMEFLHYKAFAEREGYVFDAAGHPRARPQAKVLPEGTFNQEDVDSANKNLARPDDAFDNLGTVNKVPNTLFIFDSFNYAASRHTVPVALREARVVNLLDQFAAHVTAAHEKMQAYCEKYDELGQGGLLAEAEEELSVAEACVTQLKAYAVDTDKFDSFVRQCTIVCHVLHAQGLYDLMNRGLGDYDQNEAAFKECVLKASTAYRKLPGATESGVFDLQDMIVRSPVPDIPSSIPFFLANYKKQREAYTESYEARKKKPSL